MNPQPFMGAVKARPYLQRRRLALGPILSPGSFAV